MEKQWLPGGGWFDREGARSWSDETHAPTNETLFLTKRDHWILQYYLHGSRTFLAVIEPGQAADWLSRRGHAFPSVLETQIAALEI